MTSPDFSELPDPFLAMDAYRQIHRRFTMSGNYTDEQATAKVTGLLKQVIAACGVPPFGPLSPPAAPPLLSIGPDDVLPGKDRILREMAALSVLHEAMQEGATARVVMDRLNAAGVFLMKRED